MSQIFNLPDVGEGLTEAEILTWKSALAARSASMMFSSKSRPAKSVVELPSPYTGTVEKILVSEGETIEVGTPIIAISGSAASTADKPQDAPAASADEGESGNQALVGSGPKADSVKRRARKRPASATAQNAAPQVQASPAQEMPVAHTPLVTPSRAIRGFSASLPNAPPNSWKTARSIRWCSVSRAGLRYPS